MGIWRTLGYVYAGFNILDGFILIAAGANFTAMQNLGSGPYGGMVNQIGSIALMYGGLGANNVRHIVSMGIGKERINRKHR
jgi:hypothetical protein